MSELRVILDAPRGGAENMAVDAGLLAAQRPGDSPVLRLYRWSPPAVSYGYHQQAGDFDAARIAALGYDLVRRPTGGRAILHAQEMTYAVVGASPSPLFGETLHDTYALLNRALLRFLEALGLAPDVAGGESLAEARGLVCFRSAGRHEITVGGRKLVGSAQRRTEGVFLQHGSILTGPAHAGLLDCLGGGAADPEARAELLAATTDLGALLGRSFGEADHDRCRDLLVEAFAQILGLDPVITTPPPGA